uniref:Uncharacterized protein n=1 Tax=Ditylenchus dipsaci TaxID=166011 RepID=A0A915EVE5_9BILA
MPACNQELMAQIEELKSACKQSQVDLEHREQLLNCICQLVQMDLAFAMDNEVTQVLWSSQKLLFNGVREHYLKAIKQPAKASEDNNRVAIARLNCTNVLHTLYSEWLKLALLVEATADASCKLLPLDNCGLETNGISHKLLQLDKNPLVRKFAEVLYTRLGDINRYMNNFELSKKFYNAVQRLNPSDEYSFSRLTRLANLASSDINNS